MSYTTTQYPFDTVVYITDMMGGSEWQGSGVLIAPNEVLTASHVVYNSVYGPASDIQVSPGYNVGATPYGTDAGSYIHYNLIQDPGGTISSDQSQYDFAVIHLATPLPAVGTMGLQADYRGGYVNVTGYPAIDNGQQITQPEYIFQDPYFTLYDGLALGDGSSGGPVWFYGANGTPYVAGLVSSASGSAGYFTEITSAVYNTIESWVAQDNVACFVSGTHIATLRGNIDVAVLRIGDVVRTRAGGMAPIVWIGRRQIACNRHRRPEDVWPVRIAAHAFAPGQPRRDLLLSPDHAVFYDGVLIPVRYLLNGTTIARRHVDAVTYWHVELPAHDVLFAEGLATESYLDTGNRAAFENAGGAIALHPNFARVIWTERGCTALAVNGAPVVAARRHLLRRAVALGHVLTDDPGVRVLADGAALAAEHEGQIWRVTLPVGTHRVRLISRCWSPAETLAEGSDPRRLGIAIARLWLDGRAIDLGAPTLCDGWHAAEAHWRWTDGDAAIATGGAVTLALHLAVTGTYWTETVQSDIQPRVRRGQ